MFLAGEEKSCTYVRMDILSTMMQTSFLFTSSWTRTMRTMQCKYQRRFHGAHWQISHEVPWTHLQGELNVSSSGSRSPSQLQPTHQVAQQVPWTRFKTEAN